MKGVGCLCTQPTVPPEQKHGKERPLVVPRGGERPARAEMSLRAGATLTDFYSSLGFRWARLRHSSVPTSQSSSLISDQQRPDCRQVVSLESVQGAEVRNSSWGSNARRMSSSLFFIIPALGGYVLLSQYLLKNPLVLHKKKRLGFYCTRIAHRGGKSDRGAPLWASLQLEVTSKAAEGTTDSVSLCTEAPVTIARHLSTTSKNVALPPPPAAESAVLDSQTYQSRLLLSILPL